MSVGLAIDALIAVGFASLAVRVVTGRRLFADIVTFVVFGLVVSLAWARLGSPDLALAEAAIGAGLTGALMLVAYRSLARGGWTPTPTEGRSSPVAAAIGVLTTTAVAAIGVAAVGAAGEGVAPDSAGAAALRSLDGTGLGNPVTAVLLLFRNLDTLLEMYVLLVVLLGTWAVATPVREGVRARVPRDSPLVGALVGIVVPTAVLVSFHLLLAGTDRPGGAFQGGTVLAAAGVVLVLTGAMRARSRSSLRLRLALIAGVATFVAIGAGAPLIGAAPLELPGLWAVYLIEVAMMTSIATTLLLLFTRSRGVGATEADAGAEGGR